MDKTLFCRNKKCRKMIVGDYYDVATIGLVCEECYLRLYNIAEQKRISYFAAWRRLTKETLRKPKKSNARRGSRF
jgi:hypothetical protein